jgi:predicted MPP superfamily phosphohydrolase
MLRRITKDRPFKIVGFTDTHIDDYAERLEVTMKLMVETIKAEQPDLVLFLGDNVTGGDNRARAERFQRTLTELQVPWAPVLGNHEGDNPMSVLRGEMIEIFRKSPYCMVPKDKAVLEDGTEVFGETNYTLLLQNEVGEVVHKLIFLDCGPDTTPEELLKYGIVTDKKNPDGFLKESQIAWYRDQVKRDTWPSMVFCHIPLQ